MIHFKLQISLLISLLLSFQLIAQSYQLHIKGVDRDSATIVRTTGIQTSFQSRLDCAQYINKLPSILQAKGFLTASIDSVRFDTAHAKIILYTGQVYKWARIDTRNIEPHLLEAIGWREKMFSNKLIDVNQVSSLQDKLIDHLENIGHPFAKVWLDSITISHAAEDSAEAISALLQLNKGPLYKIDSIRLYGTAKISNQFLQRYFDLPNGSVYSKEKLIAINKKIRELSYVEEQKAPDLSLLGTGSVLNVYLNQAKSSQVNVILGFLPNNTEKGSSNLRITGEGNILLKNSFGDGETIGLNFQALQVSSQRINFLFNRPYIGNTPLGVDIIAEMFRKDSSFLNINAQAGVQYHLNSNEAGKIFIQWNSTVVNEGGINPALIIQSRRLPDVADTRSFNAGVEYDYNKTDYRLNPRKGTEFNIITTIGSRRVRKNFTIVSLKDPGDPGFDFNRLYDTVRLKTYQLKLTVRAAKYFPMGKSRSTIKTALNGGTIQSAGIFKNEMYQLGGYRLLRGFDEQSQYLSSFAIGTVEFRYLLDRNSFFYVLADGGWGQDNRQKRNLDYSYFGTGLGIAFETKAGIINLAWAVGTRNDIPFNLRQSKLHFGFVNYF